MSQTINAYETTMIFRADTSEDQHNTFIEKIKTIVKDHSGKFISHENWGSKRLAFPVKKEGKGVYQYVVYSGDSNCVAEIERNIRINESIIRFLTVCVEKDLQGEYKPTSTARPFSAPPERASNPHFSREHRGDRGDRGDRGTPSHSESHN